MIAACATVYDPEIPVNIYELGLVYAIDIDDDGEVKVEMTLTAPAARARRNCPSRCARRSWRCPVSPLRRRCGLGPAMGPQPHDRRRPAVIEHVLTRATVRHEHHDHHTPHARRALPPLMALTDAAAERLRALYAKGQEGKLLRIGVNTKGCSGLPTT